MSLGPRGDRLRRRILRPLPMTLWMWRTVPLAAFAGIRVVALDERACAVRLPGGWRTQNPFRSTYFAAQAMAAEMSTGAPVIVLAQDAPASVATLVVGLRARYSKKIVGSSLFVFDEVAGLRAAIHKAATGDGPEVFAARSVGHDEAGALGAEFEITWSFKRRQTA